MTDRDAEMNAIVAMLEDAGLIGSYTDEDGKPAIRLTTRRAARALDGAGWAR